MESLLLPSLESHCAALLGQLAKGVEEDPYKHQLTKGQDIVGRVSGAKFIISPEFIRLRPYSLV